METPIIHESMMLPEIITQDLEKGFGAVVGWSKETGRSS
jgi:hypothetical protein